MPESVVGRQEVFSRLPAVDEVLREEAIQAALASLPRPIVVEAVKSVLETTLGLMGMGAPDRM